MDYADKFVMINVKNKLREDYKIYEIEWYLYFKSKKAAQKVSKIIKGMFPHFKTSVSKSPPSFLLLVKMPTTTFPKNFQKMSKTLKAITEMNNGDYDGYEFGMLQKN